jgi:hypothetical protein
VPFNLGSLGFLTPFDPARLEQVLLKTFRGKGLSFTGLRYGTLSWSGGLSAFGRQSLHRHDCLAFLAGAGPAQDFQG